VTITSGGSAVSGLPFDFQYRVTGATTWTDIGTADTNASGVATVGPTTTPATPALPTPGTYDFQAVFAGNTSYQPLTLQKLSFPITAALSGTITVTQ
jgi:hypothetical protein